MTYILEWPGGRKHGKNRKISIGNEGDTGFPKTARWKR